MKYRAIPVKPTPQFTTSDMLFAQRASLNRPRRTSSYQRPMKEFLSRKTFSASSSGSSGACLAARI